METIVALATAPLKCALHIIRVSGDDCFEIVSKVSSRKVVCPNKRNLIVSKIMDDDKHIDDVVLAVYKNPYSFTGENLVEIMCHGSVLIANQIIKLLIKHGARLATNGEYSQRAYLNQKIDLVQAEAINDVICSITKESKSLSILSLEGKTSDFVREVKDKIADLLSLIEVNIDYPEYEDIEVANKEMIVSHCSLIITRINELIKDAQKAKIINEGIKVALVGKPNVGKSSLLNALLGEEKAIVTSIPGTTRDVVEGDINLNGLTLHLLDTA
ncbi:MAG: tRNA uridine-5-carboxymethylaminomethyl(34) synthesis GTPase MnmE, partial [Bacilli bacterium]|nr:tRNA uridine-5-carboxymethylaminomethyl(34) synthesis GTPase MnmE [Bacilli bacterium]